MASVGRLLFDACDAAAVGSVGSVVCESKDKARRFRNPGYSFLDGEGCFPRKDRKGLPFRIFGIKLHNR
jgi:hypothetical protein